MTTTAATQIIKLPALPSDTPDALIGDGADGGIIALVNAVNAHVLTVGAGEEFSTISAAINASQDGDIIEVNAGTYVNDTAIVTHKITLVGVGGMVNMVETTALANEKGILVADNDLTVENFTFSGAEIANDLGANGSGIRYEGGQLKLVNDVFAGNQEGLLATPDAGLAVNTISVDQCTFDNNGVSDPSISEGYGQTHNIYIGAVQSFTATNSIFEDANVGHEIKSRAYVNTITDNIITDGNSDASYDIDLPNGGQDVVEGNLIIKGPNAQNDNMIHFGGEGFPYAGSSLTIADNTIVSEKPDANLLLNQTTIPVALTGNVIEGLSASQLASGPVVATNNVTGNGTALPDSTSNQLLPTNFQVFNDAAPHTVTLTNGGGVQGGAGLLTVIVECGHVTVIGGSGGLDYVEGPGWGGSTITTVAGATDTISFDGQDSVESAGTDTITVGPQDATILVAGTATINSGTGSNKYTVSGTADIIGSDGNEFINVTSGGSVDLTGIENSVSLTSVGSSFIVNAMIGGVLEQASDVGGSMGFQSYSGSLNFNTSGGLGQGGTITLGAGTMNVLSHAADTIHAGSGTDMLQLSGGGQTVYVGTGTLNIYGMGISALDPAKVYGNGGTVTFNGDTGNIDYFGGTLASTVDDLLGHLALQGGAGHMTINGGDNDVITGGAGGITLVQGAADTITTAAGATDQISLYEANIVNSYGNDTIDVGSGDSTLTLHGTASLLDAKGSETVTLLGQDSLTATAGNEQVTVGSGAVATITTAAFTSVKETGGKVIYTADAGGDNSQVTVTGGTDSIFSASGQTLQITTAAGASSQINLGAGKAIVNSAGADTINTGIGSATINITGNNAVINDSTAANSGALNIVDTDYTKGHQLTVNGGASAITLTDGSGPDLIKFTGGTGNAVITGGAATLNIVANAGNITASGGSGGVMQFIGGSGTANLTVSGAGGNIQFGSGTTNVTESTRSGVAIIFDFLAGKGGGKDVITGYRQGTDSLNLQGVTIASDTVTSGNTFLTLSDHTSVELVGVTNFKL